MRVKPPGASPRSKREPDVKAEDDCPQITDVRCPLFTDEIVRSSWSGRGIGRHLLSGRDGPPTQEPGLLLFPQPVALAFNVERRRVVQQAVKDRGGEHMIVKDLPPIRKVSRVAQISPVMVIENSPPG